MDVEYDELERRYYEQSAALGSQRSANNALKKHNARLKWQNDRLESLLGFAFDLAREATSKIHDSGDEQTAKSMNCIIAVLEGMKIKPGRITGEMVAAYLDEEGATGDQLS